MNKTDRDASIPRNVQLYAVDGNDQLIALKSDLSGQLSVDVTVGDIVAIVSGDINVVVESGEFHIVSGSVTLSSGGNSIGTVGITSGLVSIQSGSVSIQSGEVHVLSGELIAKTSGNWLEVHLLSGNVTLITQIVATRIVSGEVYIISGQLISKISGEVVKISGEVLKVQSPSAVLANYTVVPDEAVVGFSGGMELSSASVVLVKVKNINVDNSGALIWIGPPGVRSGVGYPLFGGDEDEYEIDNLNKTYTIAEVSGNKLAWRALVE